MIEIDRSGWRRVRFGDVVTNAKETLKDPVGAGLDRVVALEHIEPGSLQLSGWQDAADGTTFTRRFRAGQTLFAKRRAYQRKVAFAEFDGVCSGDILAFEAKPDELLPELLPFIVQSDAFFEYALRTSAGSLSPRTKWQDLATWEFDLPPLDEQGRIASLMWAVERAARASRAEADAVSLSLRALSDSRLADVPRVQARELFDIVIGRQRSPHKTQGSQTPYLRAANVKQGLLLLDDVNGMPFTEAEVSKFRLASGDVLVTEGCGSPEQIGANAVWVAADNTGEAVCFQNTLLRYRARNGVTTPSYLAAWAAWAFESGQFREAAAGTGILHIGSERAKRMLVPALDLVEQDRFAESVQLLLDGRDATRRKLVALTELGNRIGMVIFGEGAS